MLHERFEIISGLAQEHAEDSTLFAQPNSNDIYNYFQYIKQNQFSNEYIGSLLTNPDPWFWNAALSDMHMFYLGLQHSGQNNIKRAFFMTNSAGHHANNKKYELFCPFNQLFYITEMLNQKYFFPKIQWIDIDAHFGNGDKEMLDSYKKKFGSEPLNISGISFHYDAGNIEEDLYKGIQYKQDITNAEFLEMLEKNIEILADTQFVLFFWGTDIYTGDYAGNSKLTAEMNEQILELLENKCLNKDVTIMIIQTGGTVKSNISSLIEAVKKI